MYKKMTAVAVLGIACIMTIHAAGKKDNESHEADNPEGFTSSIPIENKKPGKWNFYIEAKDKAGNRTLAGPDNIWLDPASDLPIAHIINPQPNMQVQGNLNIVGSAIDDDGVDHVEFVITRGADGKGEELIRSRADGKEFWSYYLDTTNEEIWTDGVYTLTAWAFDINGLSGISEDFKVKDRKFHQVAWHLDRKKPLTKITSHEVGALVAGKINIKGTVFDGNGVKALSYSLDDGGAYRSISLKYDKRRDIYTWDLNIDTKAFEDGPKVAWFKAVDGMGTMGLDAHLLFVNNTAPDVEILYPLPDDAVNGVFTVAVYAAHPVGLKAVTWKLGKDSGTFPMIVGNPWWIQDFDIRGQKTTSLDLEIRAEDLSGNVTIARRKLKVDQNADLPVISLEEPAAGAVLVGDSLNVIGVASDNDAVASILYSLNSGEATEIPCSGRFQFTVPDLAAGTYTFDIWAKDIHGTEGPKVQVKGIIVSGDLPEPRIVSLGGTSRGVASFLTGMTINVEPKMVMGFTVTSATPITAASVSFAGRAAIPVNVKAGKDNSYSADVAVPLDLSPGLNKMTLRASDRYGREGVYEEFFYIGAGGGTSFEWVRPHKLDDGRILITGPDSPLIGLGGSLIQNASVSGSGSENIIVSVDENGRVQLGARREGSFGPLTLTMSARSGGANFRSDSFTVLADYAPPSINTGTLPTWVQERVPIQFSVSDNNRIKAVEYSLDLGATWQPLLTAGELASYSSGSLVDRTLNIASLPDGTINIHIRALDEADHYMTKGIFVYKDTEAPQMQLIMPIAEARVNGAIRLGFALKEAGSIKRVTYQRPSSGEGPAITKEVYPGSSADKGYPPRFLNIVTDPLDMPLADNMSIVVEDEAGNRSEWRIWPFIIDNEMDIPTAHIVLPLEDEVITTDFEVSGVAFDDDAIAAVYWRIDNGPEQMLETGNGFSIPIALSSLTDNEHSVTVTPEDMYGVKGAPVTRKFRVSLSEPVASISTPSFDMISAGLIEMSGGAYDENSIEKVQVSLDNGNTFNDTRLNADGSSAEWFYEFNSTILKDGAHVIFMRVEDKYGISALYSGLLNIDNTPPELTLESPQNGMVTTGPISILGQVSDSNLEAKSITLRSLEGVPIPRGFSLYRAGQSPIIKEDMDISTLKDGFYNIEVQVIDKADNVTIISRNVELARESMRNFVDVLYPLNGEYIQGNFNLYGNTGGTDKAHNVTLQVNRANLMTENVTWTGYYAFALNEEHLQPGWNEIVISGIFGGDEVAETEQVEDADGNMITVVKSVRIINGETVYSEVRRLFYQPTGAWVTIDTLTMGDFAFDRPWLNGRAGYILSEEEQEILADKNADKLTKADVQGKTLDYIDLSFDNGGTFVKTYKGRGGDNDWRYRLETGDMAEGMHYILVRAHMKNGETAITRTVLQVDKTAPHIRLIAPQAGGRYNVELEFSALATDDVALASLTYHLRQGDKFFYEVPGFLQGLYFDVTIPPFIKQLANEAPVIFAGGATYMDVGFGLSFFDDNVKIQAQYGFMTQDIYEQMGGPGLVRYGGHVLGLKILASIYTLPFASFAGPDWEWLYASLALGANFSLFDLGKEGYTQSGNRTWMGALLMQLEFPKVTIPKREKFRTFSMFTEGQLWFVPTDVNAEALGIDTVIPHIILGLRMYVF